MWALTFETLHLSDRRVCEECRQADDANSRAVQGQSVALQEELLAGAFALQDAQVRIEFGPEATARCTSLEPMEAMRRMENGFRR